MRKVTIELDQEFQDLHDRIDELQRQLWKLDEQIRGDPLKRLETVIEKLVEKKASE